MTQHGSLGEVGSVVRSQEMLGMERGNPEAMDDLANRSPQGAVEEWNCRFRSWIMRKWSWPGSGRIDGWEGSPKCDRGPKELVVQS